LSAARREIKARIKLASKITRKDGFSRTRFLGGRILDELGRKGNMLRTRRSALVLTDELPRINLFLMPFVPFLEPISPTISPEMEVDVEMVRDDTFKLTNGKAYSLGCHRKVEMAILNTGHMKSSRQTPKNSMKSQTNRTFS
jgi:hypothetical protein